VPLAVPSVREFEHREQPRRADRSAADDRIEKRHRPPGSVEKKTRGRCGRRRLAPVVGTRPLLACGPVQEECATANSRRLRLDHVQDHLHRDGRVHRRPAARDHRAPRLHGERIRGGNHEVLAERRLFRHVAGGAGGQRLRERCAERAGEKRNKDSPKEHRSQENHAPSHIATAQMKIPALAGISDLVTTPAASQPPLLEKEGKIQPITRQTMSGTISNATMLIILISGFTAGPAVSL